MRMRRVSYLDEKEKLDVKENLKDFFLSMNSKCNCYHLGGVEGPQAEIAK